MAYSAEQKIAFDRAMELIRNDDHLNPVIYKTWFKPITLVSISARCVTLSVDNAFVMGQLNNRYMSYLTNAFSLVLGPGYSVEVLLPDEVTHREEDQSRESLLNPRFTFDNFVVGDSNRLAHATALAVAECPGSAYNPLLIYGGVGLGKTHLMNAIGNYILQNEPGKKVLFITSETFTNELIEAIMQKKGTSEMRNRMRNVDVFIVDDIQFLGKTVSTQEEFFHTFNDLYAHGKQIIMSSDRNPKDIPTIEDRLRSRFEGGIIVDIQKPDFETRVAILRNKAEADKMDVPYEVIEFIARHVTSNVRVIEGTLNRLGAQSTLLNQKITLEFAQKIIGEIGPGPARTVTAQMIIRTIAEQYSVTEDDIISSRRSREIALPRQIAMFITRQLTQLSTVNIGKEFGGRDHTTVMHGCEKIEELMKSDVDFRRRIEELQDLVQKA